MGLNKANSDLSGHYYWAVGWDDEDVSNPNHWLKHASGADKHDHVMKITQSLEPKFREIFPLTPVDGILPGQAVYRDAEIPSLRTGRIVLVGDAAHLNLSEALSRIDLEDPKDVGLTLEPYQREILERGSAAVRLSRTANRNNQDALNKIVACGQVAKPTAEEVILLESCKP